MRETGSLHTNTEGLPEARQILGMKHLRGRVLVFLPLLLAPLILFSPVWLAGKALFWGTVSLQFVPWQAYAWETVRQGSLPLWNHLVGMGAPLAANYQSALFYPPNWLLFPIYLAGGVEWLAWGQGVLAALHLVWAGTGMALLARRLGVGTLGQVIAGLGYGLSGYLVARTGFLSINASAAWLPWIMLAGWSLCKSLKGLGTGQRRFLKIGRQLTGLSIAVAMQLLAGHAQTSSYTLILLIVWCAYWGWIAGRRSFSSIRDQGRYGLMIAGVRGVVRTEVVVALALVLAVGLAAVQLLPTAEYLLQSQRSQEVEYDLAMTYSFWPPRFLTLFAPDFFGNPARGDYSGYGNFWEDHLYIGLTPLLLALGMVVTALRSMFRGARNAGDGNHSLTLLLSIVVAVSFLLALGKNTPVFPWLYRNIPGFDMFQGPTRISLWAVFAFVLLGAFGADRWRRPEGRGLYWTRLGTMGAFAISLGAGATALFYPDVSPAFVRAMVLMSVVAIGTGLLSLMAPQDGTNTIHSSRWRVAAVVLVSLDLLIAGWGLNPGIDRDFYRGTSPNAEKVRAQLDGGRLYLSQEDEYALKFERFMQFRTFDPGEDWEKLRGTLLANLNMLDAIPSANLYDPLVPGRYARWMEALEGFSSPQQRDLFLNLMNVRVVETIDPQQEDGVRYKSIESGPRVRFVSCAVFARDEEQAWSELAEGNFDPMQWVVLEGAVPASAGECQSTGSAEIHIMREASNQIHIKTFTEHPGWLVLSDLWYPGWQARIDGTSVELLRANYLFRAVQLEPGEHEVDFLYTPASFWIGMAISLITGIGMALWFFVGRKSGESFTG